MVLVSFQALRVHSAKFVADRLWNQFHTPSNIVLALSGECGELCELFQWKGPVTSDNVNDLFNAKDKVAVGEEIADVFIYSTRLCELCEIDLPKAVHHQLTGTTATYPSSSSSSSNVDATMDGDRVVLNEWYPLRFDELESMIDKIPIPHSNLNIGKLGSIRSNVLKVHAQSGILCDIFGDKSEESCLIRVTEWPEDEQVRIGTAIAAICIHLTKIASFMGLSVGQCITDKYTKNALKYPVELVKGSSAKYTAYVDQIKQNLQANMNADGEVVTKESDVEGSNK